MTVAQGASVDVVINNSQGTATATVTTSGGTAYNKITATVAADYKKVTIAAAADAVAGNYNVTITDTASRTAVVAVTIPE